LTRKEESLKHKKNKQTKKSIILWIYSLCCCYSFFFNYYFKLFCAILLDRLSSCLIFLCGSDVWLCAIDSLMPSSSLLKELLESYPGLLLWSLSPSICTFSYALLLTETDLFRVVLARLFTWFITKNVKLLSFCEVLLLEFVRFALSFSSFVITAISRFLPCFFRGWLVFQCMFCISDSQPSLKFSLVKQPSVP